MFFKLLKNNITPVFIRPTTYITKRNYLKYIDDKSCHLIYNNNKILLTDDHIKTNSLLAVTMLVNKNQQRLGIGIKTNLELFEFKKIKEEFNNVEFICSEGIPINIKMEKAHDNARYTNMIINVDTVSKNTNDLIAKTKVKVSLNPVI